MVTTTGRQPGYQRRLERIAGRFSGRLGFVAKNLATGEVIAWNGAAVFPTASVIKVAILAEVFRQARSGRLDLSQRVHLDADDRIGGSGVLKELAPGMQVTVHDLATLMIVVSDNTATNLLIDLIGGVDRVSHLMRELGLPAIVLYRPIDFTVGEEAGPLAEATPNDLAQLMEMIAVGQVVDPAGSADMIAILRRQHHLDQVPRYLAYHAFGPDASREFPLTVACKTGFSPGTWTDAGIITLPDEVAIAYCAMTDGSTDRWLGPESDGAVTNGLLGRLVIEHWWPGGTIPPGLFVPSPYVDAVWRD